MSRLVMPTHPRQKRNLAGRQREELTRCVKIHGGGNKKTDMGIRKSLRLLRNRSVTECATGCCTASDRRGGLYEENHGCNGCLDPITIAVPSISDRIGLHQISYGHADTIYTATTRTKR